MIFLYRKWLARFRFILVFVMFTYLLYHVMMLLSGWIQPVEKYKPPAGKSVKVFQHQHASITDSGSISDRLRLFYWYGE